MDFDVDQWGSSATVSALDSELFAVLSAEAAWFAEEEAQSRKLSRVRSCAGVAGLSRGRMESLPEDGADVYELGPTLQRRVWLVSTPPLRRVVLP